MGKMVIESILFIIGGYLLGSVSAAYLAGKWIGGKDLRQYGSGNLGGSMVWEHVSPVAAIVAGVYDLLKAALPAWSGGSGRSLLVHVLGFYRRAGVAQLLWTHAAGVLSLGGCVAGRAGSLGSHCFQGLGAVCPSSPGHHALVILLGRRPGDHAAAFGCDAGGGSGQALGGQPPSLAAGPRAMEGALEAGSI
jgi:hypothetical protein